MRPVLIGAGVLLGAWCLGLLAFVAAMPRDAVSGTLKADAIVVLTGGEDRLAAGMALLNEGKGQRLLVSGVHEATSRTDLEQRMPELAERFACCVDLDKEALTTRGNALETARWAQAHGFHSLIVVTAHYHMPRSLMEFRRAMPGVDLVAYPVFPAQVEVDHWWSDLRIGRIVVAEYTKYLAGLMWLSV